MYYRNYIKQNITDKAQKIELIEYCKKHKKIGHSYVMIPVNIKNYKVEWYKLGLYTSSNNKKAHGARILYQIQIPL